MNIANLMIARVWIHSMSISNVKHWWITLKFDDVFVFVVMDVMARELGVHRFGNEFLVIITLKVLGLALWLPIWDINFV